MARCGIRLRYPVKAVTLHDDGTMVDGLVIGDAETLGQAVGLAEKQGFLVREADDGGRSRLARAASESPMVFLVMVYPE